MSRRGGCRERSGVALQRASHGLAQYAHEAARVSSSCLYVTSLRSNVAQVMCSFAQNGANYVHQHWYICYTCGLVDQHGCCGACVRACHAGHDTVYSSCSNFFCDCGSGSVRWVPPLQLCSAPWWNFSVHISSGLRSGT